MMTAATSPSFHHVIFIIVIVLIICVIAWYHPNIPLLSINSLWYAWWCSYDSVCMLWRRWCWMCVPSHLSGHVRKQQRCDDQTCCAYSASTTILSCWYYARRSYWISRRRPLSLSLMISHHQSLIWSQLVWRTNPYLSLHDAATYFQFVRLR